MHSVLLQLNDENARVAATFLREDRVVALPTELTYRLAARADRRKPMQRVRDAVGRHRRPLAVLATAEWARDFARVSDEHAAILERAWPGGVAFVLPRGENVPRHVSRGNAVTLICPDPWAASLCDYAEVPIATAPAMGPGDPPSLEAREVVGRFSDHVDLVLDDGRRRMGHLPTVVDLTVSPPKVLRVGAVPLDELERAVPGVRAPEEVVAARER